MILPLLLLYWRFIIWVRLVRRNRARRGELRPRSWTSMTNKPPNCCNPSLLMYDFPSLLITNLHACYMIYLPVSVYVCVLCRLRRFWRCPCLSSRSWSALLVSVCLACFTSLSFRERRHLPVSSVRISLHLHNIQYYHYSLLSLKQCAEEELG